MGRAAPSASAFFVCPPRHCTSNCRRRPASRDARSTRRSSPTFSPRPPPCRTDVLPVLSAEEMRRLDRRAIDTLGIPGAALMENAGRGAVPHIIRLLPRGGRGARRGTTAAAITAINASQRSVVALDIPSALPADGGPPPGPAVHADVTTTFAAFKRGLVTGPGLDWAGRVVVVDIGIPDAEVRRGITTFLLEASDVATHVPRRPHHAPKGIYGRLLIVAGSVGKTGAAALAARAAMRSGAGLVTVATAASQQPIVATLVLEAMTEPVPETAARSIALKAREALDELAEARDAAVVGPGLGLHAEPQTLGARPAPG